MPRSAPHPVVTRTRRLSAVYVPAFCEAPAELEDTGVTVSALSEAAPMVEVATHWSHETHSHDRLILVVHGTPIPVPVSDGETCDRYLFQMTQAIRSGFRLHKPPSAAYLESLARPLASHLARYYAGRTRERERAGLSEARLAQALAFIEAHLFGEFSIEELSGVACLSSFHFRHMFKRSTGLAPHAFVRRRRLMAAAELLASTSLPIHDIAQRTGHDNQAHFSASFRDLLGVTPSEYRSRARRGMPPELPH